MAANRTVDFSAATRLHTLPDHSVVTDILPAGGCEAEVFYASALVAQPILPAVRRRRKRGEMLLPARCKGFTLLELLVVMVIIGLLAAYVGPRYFAQIGKSEVKTARAQIDAFEKALDQYRLDIGHYPSSEQGLDALFTRPENETKWQGPYLKKKPPADPWGNKYLYKSPGEHGEFDLVSFGRDGKLGGKDEDADITNW